MKYNRLGRTGLFVSELCLGAMTFGQAVDIPLWRVIGDVDASNSERIIERALAAGVNFIDTADVYSSGDSERIVGKSLKSLGVPRKDVVLSTKVAMPAGQKPNDSGASRGHIMDSVQGSLERLQTDHIDLYQIHTNDPVTPIEETLRALDDLTRQGLVRYIGVSNWAAWKIGRALGISEARNYMRFETLQAYYSIAGRDLERELVPLINEEKLGLLVWSPLAGGLLSGKFDLGNEGPQGARRTSLDYPPVDRSRASACLATMREIAARHDSTVARVALAWLLAKPHVTSVIIGAKTVEQLDDNLAAAGLALTHEDMAALDDVSALPQEYPGWAIDGPASDRIPKAFNLADQPRA